MDIRQHLVTCHGFTERHVASAQEQALIDYHQRVHEDETAKHLAHTHIATPDGGWLGSVQFFGGWEFED